MKRILCFCVYLLSANSLFAQLNYEINNLNNSNKTKTSLPRKVDNYYWDYNTNEWKIYESNNYTCNNKFQIESINIYSFSDWKSKKVTYFYNNKGLIEKIVFLNFHDYENKLDTEYIAQYLYDNHGNDSIYQLDYYSGYPNEIYLKRITRYLNIYSNKNTEVLTERIEQYWSKRLQQFRNKNKMVFDYDSINNKCTQITYSNFDTLTNLFLNDVTETDFSWHKWNGSPFNSIEKGHTYKVYNDSTLTNSYRFHDEYDDKENLTKHHAEFWNSDSNRWDLAANSSGGEQYFTQKINIKYISNEMVEKTTQYYCKIDSSWVNYQKSVYYNFLPITSKEKEVIHVFPNPNNGFLNIETLNYNFTRTEIFDFTGKLVYSQNCSDTQLKIDLSHLNNGIYIINTQLENGQINKTKLVLSR
ncbi:MAG: T9SS type A sorting domain-containing protein [Candidatus Methylacidiphilales bacterium]